MKLICRSYRHDHFIATFLDYDDEQIKEFVFDLDGNPISQNEQLEQQGFIRTTIHHNKQDFKILFKIYDMSKESLIPVSLPEKVRVTETITKNELTVQEAKKLCTGLLNDLANVDYTKITVHQAEILDERCNKSQQWLGTQGKTVKESRTDITKTLDAIKSRLMEPEKQLLEFYNPLVEFRNNWAREKSNREKKARQEAEAKIALDAENERIKKEIRNKLDRAFLGSRAQTDEKLSTRFYSLKGKKEMDAWILQLNNWNISQAAINIADFGIISSPTIAANTIAEMEREIYAEILPTFNKDWESYFKKEIQSYQEKIPARLFELEAIAKDAEAAKAAQARIDAEAKERAETLAIEQANRQQANDVEEMTNQLNNSFDTQSAIPMISKTKNTVEKQKYVIETHEGFTALLKDFVMNDLALMTIADIQKKFSFIITACNKRLNQGELIESKGLKVEEDFSVRTSKKVA